MIIRSIRLCNFKVFAGEQSISPVCRKANSEESVTLVGGLNGYGKTSLLEAVLLALYGNRSPKARQHSQSYSGYLEGLTNRSSRTGADSWVELEVEVPANGRPAVLRIRRSWHLVNTRTVDSLTVWNNGVEDRPLADSWDAYAESLVPVGIASLFFFDGEKIGAIAESEETPDSVRQAIRSVLGLDVVDRLIADLSVLIRRNHERLRESEARREISSLQAERQRLGGEIGDSELKLHSTEQEIDEVAQRAAELEEMYFSSGGSLIQSRESLLAQRDDARQKLADARAELIALALGPLPLLVVEGKLASIHGRALEDERLTRARQSLPFLEEMAAGVLEALSTLASDTEDFTDLRQYLDSKTSQVRKLAAMKPVFELGAAGVAQLADLVGRGFLEIRGRAAAMVRQCAQLQQDIDLVEQRLVIDVDRQRLSAVLEELAQTRSSLQALEKSQQQAKRDIQSLRFKAEQLEQKIGSAGARLSDSEKAERVIRCAGRAQESLRQFHSQMTRSKIEELSESISNAFSALLHKCTLVARVLLNPDSLMIAVVDEHGSEVAKSRLSSGERQMLAVAILWGLERSSGRQIPVIIDSPLGRLDSAHRMSVVSKYMPNASSQVIVLSTDTEVVGPYLQALDGHVGARYLLQFEEPEHSTSIVSGYFKAAEVETLDEQTSPAL